MHASLAARAALSEDSLQTFDRERLQEQPVTRHAVRQRVGAGDDDHAKPARGRRVRDLDAAAANIEMHIDERNVSDLAAAKKGCKRIGLGANDLTNLAPNRLQHVRQRRADERVVVDDQGRQGQGGAHKIDDSIN